jgi:uncharacterized protein
MSETSPEPAVVHVPERSRFEVVEAGSTAVLTYERAEAADQGGRPRVALLHTVVPAELEGRGTGSRLAAAAVRWAQDEGLEVEPVCSFVAGWLERHPEAASR